MPLLGGIARGTGFFGAVGQIGGMTAVSRVLGFVRDILIAAFVGAGCRTSSAASPPRGR